MRRLKTGARATSVRPQARRRRAPAFEVLERRRLLAIDIVKLTNGTDNNLAPGPIVPVGSTATFTYQVTSTDTPGVLVVVRDDNGTPGNLLDDFFPTFTGGDTNGNLLLDPGETFTYTASRIATPGQYTNRATATSFNANDVVVATDVDVDNHFGASPEIRVTKLTNGQDANAAPGPLVPVGSTVTFTYLVNNNGRSSLSNVAVRDDNGTPGNSADDFNATFTSGDTNANGLLDTTETWTFTATRIATPGPYENFGTVTATTAAGAPVANIDVSHHFGSAPGINVVKLTNGTNNDSAPGLFLPVGSTATFTYVVTNPGNVPLSGVTVRDDNGTPGNLGDDFNATFFGGDANGNGLLDPTETWTFTAPTPHTVTSGQYTNTATARGTAPGGDTPPAVTDTDVDNHFGALPAINLVKLTNGTNNDAAPGPFILFTGAAVVFTYRVTNTGNVPLSGVVVRDDNGTPANPADDFNPSFVGGDTNSNGLLDITETWTFTGSRPWNSGQYTNVATVTGTPPPGAGPAVTDTDTENYFGAFPLMFMQKFTNGTKNDFAPGVFVPVGSTVTFTYVVGNSGNVPFSGVTVRDDNGTPANSADDFNATFVGGDSNGNGLLDTTETWTFTATRIATPGQHTNLAAATGTPPPGAGRVFNAFNADNHFGALPAISLVKLTAGTNNDAAPGLFVPVGSPVTFTYVVTNPGNVPLSGVTVRDDNGTPANPADDFNATFVGGDSNGNGLLDTTETWTFAAPTPRIATPGQYTNVGTATGTPPGGLAAVAASNPDNHFGSTPAINLVKLTNGTNNDSAPGLFLPVGSTATFTYVVTNPGNVPLSGVTVRDDNGTPADPADDFNATFVGGDTNANGLLDAAETWTFTASRIVTPGQYTNVGTATGTPPRGAGTAVTATNPDNHFGSAPGINVVKLTNGTDNNSVPGIFVPAGSTVTFTYVVTNTGNVPLSGVVVRDDNGTAANPADDFNATFVGGDANGDGLLDTTETWTFTASRVATPGQYTNVATATGTPPSARTQPAPTAVTDTDVDNHFGSVPAINVVKLTNGTNNDVPPGVFVPVGSTVTFTYIVTNPGNVPLAGVTVHDSNGTPANPADDFNATFVGGDTNGNGLLDTAETWTFTASRIATPGQYSNLATATGTPPPGAGPPVTDIDADHHFGSTPGINVVKRTNGTDNNAAPGPLVPAGSLVTFTYVVTNTGNVPLSGVVVRDDNGTPGSTADDFNATFVGGDADADGLLDTTETWSFVAFRTATPGQYTNLATVTGTPPPGAGAAVTDTDADNHFGVAPGINVVKLTNGTDSNAAPGVFVPAGSTVTFTYIVTNTGNVPLSGVMVRDDNSTPGNAADDFNATFVGGDANANGQLDTTETWTFTASRIATPGQYTNVATASGTPPGASTQPGGITPVSDTDVDNHFGGAPAISVVKLTNGTNNDSAPGPFVPAGSTVTFTYVVTNPGNVPLAGVAVVDDNGTPANPADDFSATFVGGDANGNGLLDTTETWTFTASRVATPGQYSNLATATGNPPTGAGAAPTATNPDNHFGSTPAINLVKLTNGTNNDVAPGPIVPVGSTVTLTYIVTNPGNVPLSGVTVVDDNGTPANPADDVNATFVGGDANADGLLDPTETWTFTASRSATPGQHTNLATAAGTPPIGAGPAVTDTDTDNHFGATPGLRVVKLTNGANHDTAPGVLVPVGSTVTFTYLVTNTGNVPLSGVTVRDDNGTPGNAADDFNATFVGGDTNGNGLLDISETWTFTASRIATAGQHTNVATATGTPPTGAGAAVTGDDPDNHFGGFAGVQLVKLTNGTDNNAAPGVLVPAGRTLTFTYVVTNTGNVPLSSVSVADDNGTPANPADNLHVTFVGGDANGDGLLDPTETWTFTASGAARAGLYTNLATASGRPPAALGARVSADDPENVFGSAPGIRLVKLTNATDNNVAPGVVLPVGRTVIFTYLVTNPGNVPLSGVSVRDDNATASNPADDFNATFLGGDANANGLLDTGETWTFTARRVATAGQHTNLATASGAPAAGVGPGVSATDVDNHFGLTAQPAFVTAFRRLGVHAQPTQLVVAFSAPLDPRRAQDPRNYSVVLAGADRRFGTRDDVSLALSSVIYNPATRTATLRPSRLIDLHTLARLTVQGTPPGGLTDLSGKALDGDHNGRPGGDFVVTFEGLGPPASAPAAGVGPAPSTTLTARAISSTAMASSLPPSAVDAVLNGGGLRLPRRARRP